MAERYLRSTLGTRLVTNIKPYDIQALCAEMLSQGLSPQTILYKGRLKAD